MPNNERKESRFGKNFILSFILAFVIEAVIFTCIFLYEYLGLYNKVLTDKQLNSMMSDSFIFPGIAMILLFLVMWVSKNGAFDALSYGVKLVFYRIFYKNIRDSKLPATYYDYRMLKSSKTRTSNLYLLFASIPFLIVGITFTIRFYC